MNNAKISNDEYERLYKLGKKDTKQLLVLDDILKEKNIVAPREIQLGIVQIPMSQIVGTKTEGRSSAFTGSFYPTLGIQTEFASKWMSLYQSHVDEGIRDPIKAYEFMNRFYVEEGNKRVSVLSACGAISIAGEVTRIVVPRSDDKEVRVYYEFLDFYDLSQVNYINFSQEGSYAKLQELVGKRPDEVWTEEERKIFASAYYRFLSVFEKGGGEKLDVLPDDAFLSFIEVYDYKSIEDMSTYELKEKMDHVWQEFKLLSTDESVELQMDPTTEGDVKKSFLDMILPTGTGTQKVAFIHEKTAQTSGWTYAHELGRMHVDEVFGEQVETVCYENATEENIEAMIEQAIEDGCKIIFTTSPPLLIGSLKAAVEHPDIKILNCSLHHSYRTVRTYYARMYEAKFLMGAIAGAMADNGKIGYVADYPILGMIANINAFALGAKMVNPRAKIYLEWSTVKGSDPEQTFAEHDARIISGRDIVIPGETSRHFGVFRAKVDSPVNLAMPIWHWGKFYEQMIHNIMEGIWKYDDASDESKGLNYWWGMSSGIIDVICSKHLPIGTKRLIDLLRKTIKNGDFNPFTGYLYSQNGPVQKGSRAEMSPEDIITMDWLAENVIGTIPKSEELNEGAIPVMKQQGIELPE